MTVNEDSTFHVPHPRALDKSQFADAPRHVRSIFEIVASGIEVERERLRPILGKGEYHARGLFRRSQDMVDSMDWEDILLRPETIHRCAVEAESKPLEIIQVVLTHCQPQYSSAFAWMHAFYALADRVEQEVAWPIALQVAQMVKERTGQIAADKRKKHSKKIAQLGNAEHNARGDTIREVWASGIYATRDLCAEKEWKRLGFKTEQTARNRLKKTSNPDPWPAKGM